MKKIVLCFILIAMATGCSGKNFNKDMIAHAKSKGFDAVEKNGKTYLAKDYNKENFKVTQSRIGLFDKGFEIRDSLNIIYTFGNDGGFSTNIPFSKSCNLKEGTCDNNTLKMVAQIKKEISSEFDLNIEDYGFAK